MKHALAFLFLLVTLAPGAQAGDRREFLGWFLRRPLKPVSTAAEVCKRQYQVMSRTAKLNNHAAAGHQMITDITEALQSRVNNEKVADGLMAPTEPEKKPFTQPIEGGTRYLAEVGLGQPLRSPEEQARMEKRLARMREALKDEHANVETVFVDNPGHILEMLRSPGRVSDPSLMDTRQFMVVMTGAIAMLVGEGTVALRAINNHEDARSARIKAMIDGIETRTVRNRQQHLQMIRQALEANSRKPDKWTIDAAIADHERWLDQQEKLGKKFRYGARFKDYDKLGNGYISQSDLRELSDTEPPKLKRTVDLYRDYEAKKRQGGAVAQSIGKEFREEDFAEVNDGSEVASAGVVFGGAFALMAGDIGALWLAHNAAGEDARHAFKLALGTKNRVPELKEIEQMVADAVAQKAPVPGKQAEWIWLGTRSDGTNEDIDFLLNVDRSTAPARVRLFVMRYPAKDGTRLAKPGEAAPPPEPVEPPAPAAPPLALNDLQQKLEIEKFPTVFGEELAPLKKVFETARKMVLSPHEQARFQNAALAMTSVKDVAQLERLLQVLGAERNARLRPITSAGTRLQPPRP